MMAFHFRNRIVAGVALAAVCAATSSMLGGALAGEGEVGTAGVMDPVDPEILEAMRPPSLPTHAFQESASSVLDLTPDEIRVFRSLVEQVQRAQSSEIRPVNPRMTTTVIDTDPGTPPPELYLRVGYDTSVAFLDALGEPWKVRPVSMGDSEAYSVEQADDNVLVLHAKSAFRPSNFTVMLEGRSTPLMVHLVNGEEDVDYLRIMQMPELSPESTRQRAKSGQSLNVPVINDPDLTAFLDGVPPPQAERIPSLDDRVRAWLHRDRMVIRTRMDLLSHADSTLHGRDDWKVYELREVLPSLILSEGGAPERVQFVLDDLDFATRDDRAKGGR